MGPHPSRVTPGPPFITLKDHGAFLLQRVIWPADTELASEIPVTLQTSELTSPEEQTPGAWGDSARARIMLFSVWAQHGEAAATPLVEAPSEEGAPVPKSAED